MSPGVVLPGGSRRPAGSLLEQPLQAPPVQWRGVQQGSPTDPPVLREWLVISRNLAEAEQQRRALQPYQLSILRRQQLPHLQRVISVYRIAPERDLRQLERDVRQAFPDWQQELNQRYLPLEQAVSEDEAAVRQWGQVSMGRLHPAPATCGRGLTLALLDGPVNQRLAEFAGADLSYRSLLPPSFSTPSAAAARHGTSLAVLLLGRHQIAGLLPGVRLHALGIFAEDASAGLHTRSDWVIQALDHLAGVQPPVQVVNLSFGGAYSLLLEQFFAQLAQRMQFVAAAGNDGREGLRYPAAYPSVLAVGAVDAAHRRLRQSNWGAQLALVAPGEDIWTLDEGGQGYYASGTSFAAPFVSAALALYGSPKALQEQALNLGPPGRDAEYGAGLAQLPDCP
ncbi:MAG: S8 family serine peptidase [Pseudomonas sp.]|uniref:S8 family serine peptidase n=1 Tax=Pseudomonas sp. TaxID=306 RepID=UPI00339AE94C